MRKHAFIKALTLSLVLGLSVAACGDDETTTEGETTTETGDDTSTEAGDDDAAGETTTEDDASGESTTEDDATTTEMDDAGPADELGNIVEVASGAGDFSLLVAAVEAAGLAETLSSGEFTVFAPTDAAITATLEALGVTVEDFVADTDALTAILTYHVVEGTVLAETVVTLDVATTVQGSPIKIEVIEGGVVLNESVNVTDTDIMASNGVIHVIDAVLLPPMEETPATFCEDYAATCGEWPAETACADWWAAADEGSADDATGATQGCYAYHLSVAATMEDEMDIAMHCAHAIGGADANGYAPCNGNIVEVAGEAGGFTLLASALTAAGLADTIATGGPFTVFAPTDDAITASLEALNLSVEEFVADSELLTSVLTYHVVDGVALAADVVGMDKATTLQGSDVMIEVIEGEVVLNGTVKVTATDILANNGVIHVIDAVLMPPMDETPATFCDDYVATCGAWTAETSCADWWAAAEMGNADDATGATQGCYAYHLSVAATMEAQADIDMHCAHAMGGADMNGYAPCNGNIAEVAEAAGSFTSLLAALSAADLADTIATGGPFTVFAPTDEAFTAALAALGLTFEELAADVDTLSNILLYHVVDGAVPAATAVTLTEAPTLLSDGADGFEVITIDATDGVVLNGTANVTATDVWANNGVIHVIDAVLLPPAE